MPIAHSTQHTAPHCTTPHHTTPHPEYSPALPTGWVPAAKPPTTQGPATTLGRCTNSVRCTHAPVLSTSPGIPRPLVTGRLGLGTWSVTP